MSKRSKTAPLKAKSLKAKSTKKTSAGPIAFFVALFIIALGFIQLISTFHTYALNLSELNNLKKQEASLIAQKKDLENDIARWDDDAYVTAQARERLGYVFPGEQAIRVEHPEAVTGTGDTSQASEDQSKQNDSKLPWYSELSYDFEQADAQQDQSTSQKTQEDSSSTSSSDESSQNHDQ